MRYPFLWLSCLVATAAVVTATPLASAALDRPTAVHVLDRLTFGATITTLGQLQAAGLDGWLEAQLRPGRVADGRLESRLGDLSTLAMTPRQLAETYYLPALERRRAARLRAGEDRRPAPPGPGEEPGTTTRSPGRRDGSAPERQVILELTTAKLVRAAAAERQLEEVLVDFWSNHFNVFAGKGPVRQYVGDFERTAIRPHVLGKFRDMLGAVSAHPAMLFYLDNWQSSVAGTRTMRGTSGLNENYARELLELHTLGVDGGYTQHDIVEVARAFTGWTIRTPRAGGEAFFDRRRHDRGAKVVLGQAVAAGGGREEGERVLDIVASHPATARHLARKLAVRFVSDTPPDALVTRVAARFAATGGDLRATLDALVRSPEFLAREVHHTKVKTPFEFVVSALRVLDVDVRQGDALGRQLRTLGMPPYFAEPPTGYSDRAEAWANAGALVQRLNIAMALAQGRVRGVSAPSLPALEGDTPHARARSLGASLALRDLAPSTLKAVGQGRTVAEMAALTLGSPEFQRK
jgi:uncharacterized protein (DUF1800 family)